MARLAAALLLALVVAPEASAVTLIEQHRDVRARAYWEAYDWDALLFVAQETDEHETQTEAAGPWMDDAQAEVEGPLATSGSSSAGMDSDLVAGPMEIWAGGQLLAESDAAVPEAPVFPVEQSAYTSSFSTFMITFSIDNPNRFHLDYAALVSGDSVDGDSGEALFDGFTYWKLEGEVAGRIDRHYLYYGESEDSASWLLAPDVYTFTAEVGSSSNAQFGGFAYGDASLAFDLHVPEPAVALLLATALPGLVLARRRAC